MKIVLWGNPIPKMRPRLATIGSLNLAYDPQKKVKNSVSKYILSQIKLIKQLEPGYFEKFSLSEYFSVQFFFYLPIAKSLSYEIKNASFWEFRLPSQKPDIDNLEKFYLDCANGILWEDDKQVVEIKSKKLYSEKPRVEIIINEKEPIVLEDKWKEILLCFSPEEFKSFSKHTREIGSFLNVDYENLNENEKKIFLNNIAFSLSDYVSRYDDILKRIKKKL